MKRISLILLACLCTFSVFADVTIDKENCTITKDGKTFSLWGEVRVIESGTADFTVKVLRSGSCDLEVKAIKSGLATSCGEWKFISSGIGDFTIRIIESGTADLEIKFIESGIAGFYFR